LATVRQLANGEYSVHVIEAAGDRALARGYPGPMSSAAAAVHRRASGQARRARLSCCAPCPTVLAWPWPSEWHTGPIPIAPYI